MNVRSMMLGLTVLLTGLYAGSCTNKKDEVVSPMDCGTTVVQFSTDVSPIIQTSCAINSACHGAGSVNGPGPLTSYPQISKAAIDIREAVVSREMPLGSTLSDASIQKIKCWVNSGALDN